MIMIITNVIIRVIIEQIAIKYVVDALNLIAAIAVAYPDQ